MSILHTHAFFPLIAAAHKKLMTTAFRCLGWVRRWLADDESNTKTVLHDDIVNWFLTMRKKGFKIKQVGFDCKVRPRVFQENEEGRL